MSHYVRTPVLAIVGGLLAIVLVILTITLLAGVGSPITVANSNALVSTATGYNDILPYIALILASGVILTAISGKRG